MSIKMFWLIVLCTDIIHLVLCFNLDVDHAIILENPDISQNTSFFGYSIVLYSDGGEEKWIKVGAPKATYHASKTLEIQHSGVVYHCPYMETCKIGTRINYDSDHNFNIPSNLTNSWTGGAMDIGYKYKTLAISAARWQYLNRTKNNIMHPFLRGGIFIENFENMTLQSDSPLQYPETKRTLNNLMTYYSRALTGFSTHFIQSTSDLLVGAPGVYNSIGTVLIIKNTEKKKSEWQYKIKSPGGNYHEYTGYAVTSGYFYDKKHIFHVAGIPRGQKDPSTGILLGSVVLYKISAGEFENQYKWKLKEQFFGSQNGEYFGAALAAGDLNGDELEELIIGAPFRTNYKNGYNHGSVYVLFGHRKKLKQNTKDRIDGTVTNGLLGTAVMFLGDLDNDKCGEFAVSAPNEDTTGVVYIYTYDKISKKLVMSQRITGKSIHLELKGFGMSFSRPNDIDANHFNDIAVGAPISGHVIILRARPTVSITMSLQVPQSLKQTSTTLSFKCCYSYIDYPESTLRIIRKISIDEDIYSQRFSFNQTKKQSEEKEIEMERQKLYCEAVTVHKMKRMSNYKDPISITLTYNIPENSTASKNNNIFISNGNPTSNDTFCKKCPILGQRSSNSEKKLIMWDQLCGGQICSTELFVDGRFGNLSKFNTYILGSAIPFLLEVTVSKKRDPPFLPTLDIVLPNEINVRRSPVNCENSDVSRMSCDMGEELHDEVTYIFELNVDDGTSETELKIFLNTSTKTKVVRNSGSLNMTLRIEREADFEITGESKEASYVYKKGKPDYIQNIFKISKFGPSPVSEIEADIIVPYKIQDSTGVYRQFATIRFPERELGSHLFKCENMSAYELKKRRRRDVDVIHSDKTGNNITYSVFQPSSIFYLNRSVDSIRFAVIKCIVGPFESADNYVELPIEMEMNLTEVEDLFKPKESLLITMTANIYTENCVQTGNRSDNAEVSNFLVIEKERRISLWIIIASATVGFIILIVFSICLAKAGFFERKEQQKLKLLKEEALEEERILETMIERELANGSLSEDDIVDDTSSGIIRNKKFKNEIEEKIQFMNLNMNKKKF